MPGGGAKREATSLDVARPCLRAPCLRARSRYSARACRETPDHHPATIVSLPSIMTLTPDRAGDVERLLDRAFGLDRRTRTAYKVRGDATPIAALGFMAEDDGALIGSIQCWPVALFTDGGDAHPLVMVGPVAVAPDRQQDGIGRRLTDAALDAAASTGMDAALMLIGDPEYYGRFFGFSADRTAGWRLPGPVERHRLLARGPAVPDVAGRLGPALRLAA